MGEDTKEAFTALSRFSSVAESRSETPFVSGNCAFDLPPLTKTVSMFTPFHQAAVRGFGPAASRVPAVEGEQGRTHPQLVSTQRMVVFAVVAGVSEYPIKGHMAAGLPQGGRQFGRILTRAFTDDQRGKQMRSRMTDQRQFRPSGPQKPPIATAQNVVPGGRARFHSGGVDRSFRTPFYTSQVPCPAPDRGQQAVPSLVFWNRLSACHNVEWSGMSSSSPNAARKSPRSLSRATIPR
jgi:hypothetical protein